MIAEDIMTEDVTTVAETVTLAEALELMEEHGFRHLPVVRGQEVVGMLSDRDLRGYGVSLVTDMESLDALKARLGQPIAQAMSADVITVTRDADVREIIDVLIEEKISAVPVVGDRNQLVGIVSYIDVLRVLRDQVEQEAA
jgi:acetoin utilization protein AcuB